MQRQPFAGFPYRPEIPAPCSVGGFLGKREELDGICIPIPQRRYAPEPSSLAQPFQSSAPFRPIFSEPLSTQPTRMLEETPTLQHQPSIDKNVDSKKLKKRKRGSLELDEPWRSACETVKAVLAEIYKERRLNARLIGEASEAALKLLRMVLPEIMEDLKETQINGPSLKAMIGRQLRLCSRRFDSLVIPYVNKVIGAVVRHLETRQNPRGRTQLIENFTRFRTSQDRGSRTFVDSLVSEPAIFELVFEPTAFRARAALDQKELQGKIDLLAFNIAECFAEEGESEETRLGKLASFMAKGKHLQLPLTATDALLGGYGLLQRLLFWADDKLTPTQRERLLGIKASFDAQLADSVDNSASLSSFKLKPTDRLQVCVTVVDPEEPTIQQHNAPAS